MNAGRRLHLRVTLIADSLLPRVMRSDPRPGCVTTEIVSARRDAEETGPSLTAGRRPRREPPTAAPRRCVESGSCPEPEDPWCRFGFRCKLNCTKCLAGIAGCRNSAFLGLFSTFYGSSVQSMDTQLEACQHLLSRSDRFGLLELRVFSTFLNILRLICSVHGYPARRAGVDNGPQRFTEVVLNERSPFGRPDVSR